MVLPKNYGIGAKIAALPRNPAGLLYLSWKNGVGYHVHLWRDPDTGEYGLKQFERPDGTFDHWTTVDDDVKPEPIKDHGTMEDQEALWSEVALTAVVLPRYHVEMCIRRALGSKLGTLEKAMS